MLSIDHISDIEIYSDQWKLERIGRFTSSKIAALMAQKPMTEGAITYIDQKASEFITKQTMAEDEVFEDENTAWGNQYENEALQVFGSIKKLQYLVTQKMIYDPKTRFSSTPDALWIIDSSVLKENHYNVASVEAKCPRKYARFLLLWRCATPADLKKESKTYYWQVLDQMDNCNAALGYFIAYHPLFPKGKNARIIEFRKIDLWDDFKLLQQRKKMALERFNEIIAEFIG